MKRLIIYILLLLSLRGSSQSFCDSISYEIGSGSILNLIAINNSSTSVDFIWMACNSDFCFSDIGDTVHFHQVSTFDTVKLCFDAFPCYRCDSLVFVGGSWQSINSITSIHEIIRRNNINSRIYTVLGREVKLIPVGKIYIRNNRSYLRILLE